MTVAPLAQLKVNPEYEALLPKLSTEEFEALKVSIKTEGQHYPIIVNEQFEILDGHHRSKVCEELSIEPKIERKIFETKTKEKKFVLESNLLRRHLDVWNRIQVGKPLLEVYRIEAEERQLATLKRGELSPDTQNFGEREKGEALAQFADAIHSNPETVRQAFWIEENAPERIAELEKGETIWKVYKEAKRVEAIEQLKLETQNLPPLNDGLFDLIIIDPPWPVGTQYDPEHWRGALPYPEMTLEAIGNINLPMAENCIVWLWTTNAFLHDAYHLLERWGLIPKSVLTWVKDKMGLGVWLRGQTEHCILAVKGHPQINLTNQTTALNAPTRGHSIKPDEFYSLVESHCHAKRRLDYFARTKREGWVCYGTLENS